MGCINLAAVAKTIGGVSEIAREVKGAEGEIRIFGDELKRRSRETGFTAHPDFELSKRVVIRYWRWSGGVFGSEDRKMWCFNGRENDRDDVKIRIGSPFNFVKERHCKLPEDRIYGFLPRNLKYDRVNPINIALQ